MGERIEPGWREAAADVLRRAVAGEPLVRDRALEAEVAREDRDLWDAVTPRTDAGRVTR